MSIAGILLGVALLALLILALFVGLQILCAAAVAYWYFHHKAHQNPASESYPLTYAFHRLPENNAVGIYGGAMDRGLGARGWRSTRQRWPLPGQWGDDHYAANAPLAGLNLEGMPLFTQSRATDRGTNTDEPPLVTLQQQVHFCCTIVPAAAATRTLHMGQSNRPTLSDETSTRETRDRSSGHSHNGAVAPNLPAATEPQLANVAPSNPYSASFEEPESRPAEES